MVRDNYALKEIYEKKIHRYVKFDRPIMMDSGGFLFMKRKEIDVTADDIIELYEKIKPNFGVVLDHPITPDLSYYEIQKRRHLTLRNTKRMMDLRRTKNPEIIPVIHGFNTRSVNWFVNNLQKIAQFNTYGIGSLVPSVFNAKGIGGISNVIKIIINTRRLLPQARLHVFGVGSITTMNMMFFAGANSVDSSAWRTKAAYGAIQLAGIGDRYITGRAGKDTNKIYKDLSRKEKKILEECRCPACRKEGLKGLRRSFSGRALHNAWVFQKEIENIRKLRQNDEYEEYARGLIGNSIFKHNLKLIDSLRSK